MIYWCNRCEEEHYAKCIEPLSSEEQWQHLAGVLRADLFSAEKKVVQLQAQIVELEKETKELKCQISRMVPDEGDIGWG